MSNFLNTSFYPTPKPLIKRMIGKIQKNIHNCWSKNVLEPSCGRGDIIEALQEELDFRNISAIEIDPDLRATLRGKKIKVIDSDFLAYSGYDKFDLIISNPPFAEGDKHLLKAINIMYRGEIVFLLNAETIKNPFTNTRKELVKRLTELKADIEYIPDAFKHAERPAEVEAALIYINIERRVEDDLFADCGDKTNSENPEINEKHEVSTKKTIEELVAEYNEIIKIGLDTIVGYYKNYRKVGKYIGLDEEVEKYSYGGHNDLTGKMQKKVNDLVPRVRNDFWRRTLDLKEISSRMTSSKKSEFEMQLKTHCDMEFTESNIRQFVLNFIGGYEKSLVEAVLDIFDEFTVRHCYSNGLYDENIHYFNGWKTNKAFKVNKKVIMPVYLWDAHYFHKWQLDSRASEKFRDIDVVMNYFDGSRDYYSINQALENAFKMGQTAKIKSTYFTITVYKKGTAHLVFNSEDILRRFNVVACQGREFLPHDYGNKVYQKCTEEEKTVIDSFEGEELYNKTIGQPLFANKITLPLLAA